MALRRKKSFGKPAARLAVPSWAALRGVPATSLMNSNFSTGVVALAALVETRSNLV